MEEFFFDLGVSAVLSSLRVAIRNPERARKLRNVFLKIAKKIFEVYGTDPDFQKVLGGSV